MLDQIPLFADLPTDDRSWPFHPLERGAYGLICADPAWTFLTYSDKGLKKSPQRHYSCMSLEEIKALPVAELAAPDCGLMLWATAPMLQQALDVMMAWGFVYKSQAVWVKTTVHGKIAFGTGYRIRNSHEIILIGVRGNPKNTKTERSAIIAPAREHSRKPDEFYAMAERWLPDVRRADLFSRQTRPSWESWGNESTRFDQGVSHVDDRSGQDQSAGLRPQDPGSVDPAA